MWGGGPGAVAVCLTLCCFHSYISKVDVLKILVSANYKYIPSLDDILETSAVTRLRNQLLEAEHYQLAVEVRLMGLYSYYSSSHMYLSGTLHRILHS